MQRTKTFISNFIEGNVQITKDIKKSLTQIIEEDYLAINSEYKDPLFTDGSPKEWIGDPERIMSTRLKSSTDIDTKNIQVNAENEKTIALTALLKGVLRHKLKVEDYGTLLNEVRDELIDMGHVIIKKTASKTEIVDLRNVIRPPHIMDIQQGGICEKVYMTYDEMLANKKEWKSSWTEIEGLKEKMDKEQKSLFIVYEHWRIDEFLVAGKKKQTKGCVKSLDRSLKSADEAEDWNPYLELDRFASPEKVKIQSKSKIKALQNSGYIGKNEEEEPIYPYDEVRFVTLKGRWKGGGVYEILKPIGKAYRRNMNNKMRFDEINHKGIAVHKKGASKGKGLTQEALQALQYGGVVGIKSDEDLQRLNFGSLIGEFLASADKFMELARLTMGITAQAAGQETPASQSATAAAIDQNVSRTTFDVVIEQQALLWKRYFAKFELASMLEDITLEDWSKLEGDPIELEELEEPFIENLVNENLPHAVAMGAYQPQGSTVSPEEMEMLKEGVRSQRRSMGGIRFAQIKKEILKDADFFIEFSIGNESLDKVQDIAELKELKADAMANPNSSLSVEKLEDGILDLMDKSSKRFKKSEQEKKEAMMALQQIPNTSVISQPQPNAPI